LFSTFRDKKLLFKIQNIHYLLFKPLSQRIVSMI